ncbi:MAG TPA: nitroreductase family protein, partial [Nitrososphaeraceae archaeon]|nr:nitroreductase family protein [Nitrososphaeraceae archaeon]
EMGLVYLLRIRSKGMSEFDDIIKRRKMVRQYVQDKPIPQGIVDKLIANAHRAPSAGHTQVQEFIIVQDPLIKEKLGEAALNQEQVYDAPLLIVVCANTSRSIERYGKRGKEFYSIIDGAFASMLILLTAVNEGIGACFVGAFLDDKVSELLELPKYVKPIGIIALGFPAEDPGKFKRIDISKLVHYEKYSDQKQEK